MLKEKSKQIIIGNQLKVFINKIQKKDPTFGPDYYSIVFFLIGFLISGGQAGFESYLLDMAPQVSIFFLKYAIAPL